MEDLRSNAVANAGTIAESNAGAHGGPNHREPHAGPNAESHGGSDHREPNAESNAESDAGSHHREPNAESNDGGSKSEPNAEPNVRCVMRHPRVGAGLLPRGGVQLYYWSEDHF